MPLSYQRKIHRGEIHPVTLHPCKRQEKLYLTEQRPDIPWIHLPSSGLVRIWSLGRSQQLFFCVFSHFRHGDKQMNNQPTNRVILEQACSWPVRRQSFAIKNLNALCKIWKNVSTENQFPRQGAGSVDEGWVGGCWHRDGLSNIFVLSNFDHDLKYSTTSWAILMIMNLQW